MDIEAIASRIDQIQAERRTGRVATMIDALLSRTRKAK